MNAYVCVALALPFQNNLAFICHISKLTDFFVSGTSIWYRFCCIRLYANQASFKCKWITVHPVFKNLLMCYGMPAPLILIAYKSIIAPYFANFTKFVQ